MDTGSLTNHILARSTKGQPEPIIGMGVTLLHWTDRTAATIIRVGPTGKLIQVQEDKAVRTDSNGMSEQQSYDYFPNPDGATAIYTFRKNGSWVHLGEPMKGGSKLRIGDRETYHDYSF